MRPWSPASLREIRPQPCEVCDVRCLSQTPSVPAVTMQEPGTQGELAGRIPGFFFFFLRHSCEYLCEAERRPVIFLGHCPFILKLIRWPRSVGRVCRHSTGTRRQWWPVFLHNIPAVAHALNKVLRVMEASQLLLSVSPCSGF